MRRSSWYFCLSVNSLSQYSSAAGGSWIEQGPITTRRRLCGSVPVTTETASLRPAMTVAFDLEVWGISCWRRSGGVRGLYPRTYSQLAFYSSSSSPMGMLTSPIFTILPIAYVFVLNVVGLSMSQSMSLKADFETLKFQMVRLHIPP